ncbi:MAG TPA: S53 family peptidase [Pyrinomonadaceae bacterium]|nr:S53 family peptidase [Pyrinomonadaceae bacterium]
MSDRKVFANSVTPLPEDGITPTGMIVNKKGIEHKKQKMTLLFSLDPPKETIADLEAKVARGEVVPPKELQKAYSPKPADVKKLKDWLKAKGYKITQTSKDNSSIYAEHTVAKIEDTLKVNMVRVTRDGVTYTSAQNAPSLPKSVGAGVNAIIGLQPFRQAHKNSRMFVPSTGNRISKAKGAPAGPTTNISNAPPYLVAEIMKAYNADGLNVTGKGQTIAILIDTFPADSDLQKFWTKNNLPTSLSRITKINVKGGPLPPAEGEETLDAEWASGIARDAKIRIYASGSLSFVDLDRALDRIIADLPNQPGMRQLSISLGLGETFMSPGEVAVEHAKFLQLAAAGVNVFVSSGDAGSNPSASGHSSNGPLQAEYESSDSSVIGVGGTRLTLSGGGTVSSEVAWSGSGGGQSIFFDRPIWQTGTGVPAGNKRLVPDVSSAADPNKGAFLVFQGQTSQIGGTSWSAPMWAGFCALINQARSLANKPFLPFLNPLIYPLMGTSAFRDIKSGSNGAFSAGTGYDRVTGIGVPNVKKLIAALA